MRFHQLNPDLAYRGSMLWLPKRLIPLDTVKAALTYWFVEPDSNGNLVPREVPAWREEQHHIVVPREFPQEKVPCEVVDIQQETETVNYNPDIAPRSQVQVEAMGALDESRAGILNLACVAEGTELRLNRGGKGFRMNIETAYERFNDLSTRYTWDNNTPTYTRAKKGDVIGLTKVAAVIYKGMRPTVRVTLEDGTTLVVTEDHEILSSSGFRKAGSCLLCDAVVDTQERIGKKPKPRYKRLSWYPSHPYVVHLRRKGRKDGYTLDEHRAVAEATLNNMTLLTFRERCRDGEVDDLVFLDPQEYVVHHEDENIENNHPDNLTIMSTVDHIRHHHPGYAAFGRPGVRNIVSVEPAGVRRVYDVACAGPHHNFVANGVVVHNCGLGKTVVALHRIAVGGGPALVVVNNSGILEQWILEIRARLRIPTSDIGVVQGKRAEWDKPVVVGTVQTIFRRLASGDIPPWARGRFVVVVFDEAHHMAAREFNPVAGYFHGDRFGLTATAERTDGNERFYLYHLGPIIYSNLTVDVPPTIFIAHSGIEPTPKERDTFFVQGIVNIPRIRAWQAKNAPRNRAIADLVQSAQANGHKVIVLTHSKRDHIPRLKKLLPGCGEITSDVKGQKRIDALRTCDIVVGTVGAAQEGLDREDLSVGVWATTTANENEFQQGTGRLARSSPGKERAEAVFVVDNVPKCEEHARLIIRYAKRRGYKIEHFKL